MPDGDDSAGASQPDGWEGVDEFTTEVTLPDGSTVTLTTDGKGGPTKFTQTDRDGNFVKSWDSDDVYGPWSWDYEEDEPPSAEFPLFDNVRHPQLPVPASLRSAIGSTLWAAMTRNKHDEDAEEPALQRYHRLIREGKDPGPDPRESGESSFDGDVVVEDSIVGSKVLDWFRRAPVTIPITIVPGVLVVVALAIAAMAWGSWRDVEPDDGEGSLPGLDDDVDEESQVEDEGVGAEPEATTEEEDDESSETSEVPVESGTRLIAGTMDTECGGQYDVTLRHMRFNNQQENVDQTFTLNGSAMQSATGWGNNNVSILSWTEAGFYEVWFFIWNLGDLLAILNVYGTSADFAIPESPADVAAFDQVQTAPDLVAAVNGSPDSCAGQLAITSTELSAFPEASG